MGESNLKSIGSDVRRSRYKAMNCDEQTQGEDT